MNRAPRRRRRWLRRMIWTLLLLLALAFIGSYGYAALKREHTVTYDSYTATTGSISNALSFSGNLQLIDSQSCTASANTSVRKLYVAAGDEVHEGDRLARLANGTIIEADLDGRVNALSVAEGDEVHTGDAILQLADFTHLRVAIRVDEYDIGDVAVGQACSVTATATERRFESEIAAIDYISASGGNVAYYTATCNVDVGADDGVYPGMQVSVSIPREEANDVVVLNMNALSFDEQNSAFVYMKDEGGALIEVPVEVGVSNGSYVEIKSGLADGDEVFVESEQEEETGGLFANLFGGAQFNAPQGGMDRGNMPGGDFSERGAWRQERQNQPGGAGMGGGAP